MRYLILKVVYLFKEKGVNTKRYDSVVIKTEQEDSNWYFSSFPNPSDGKLVGTNNNEIKTTKN